MKQLFNIKHVVLTATAMMYLAAQAQNYGVNIVFTDLNKVTAIDTIIPANEEALEDLYSAFDLNREEIHEIFLNESGISWVGKEDHGQKVMVINKSHEEGEIEGEHQVKVIHMSHGDESMSDEEMNAMIKKIKTEHIDHSGEGDEVVMEKIIRVDKRMEKEGEGPEDELEIRVVVEDGVETIEATKNGVKLSEEEARELFESQNVQVIDGAEMEKEMIFISEEEFVDGENIFIEKHEIKSNDPSDNIAVAIIKEFPAAMGAEEAEAFKANSLNVFPNPASNEIKAQLEGVEGDYAVTITNLAGQVLRKEVGNASSSAQHTVNLEGMPSGTYILSIDHEGGVKSEKFVVE